MTRTGIHLQGLFAQNVQVVRMVIPVQIKLHTFRRACERENKSFLKTY